MLGGLCSAPLVGQPRLGAPRLREGRWGRPGVADGTLGWRGPWLTIKTGPSLQYLSWEQEGPGLFGLWEVLGNGDAGVERPGRAGDAGSRGSPHGERATRRPWDVGRMGGSPREGPVPAGAPLGEDVAAPPAARGVLPPGWGQGTCRSPTTASRIDMSRDLFVRVLVVGSTQVTREENGFSFVWH